MRQIFIIWLVAAHLSSNRHREQDSATSCLVISSQFRCAQCNWRRTQVTSEHLTEHQQRVSLSQCVISSGNGNIKHCTTVDGITKIEHPNNLIASKEQVCVV